MRIALCSYSQKEKETALLMKLGKVDRFDNGVFCVYAMQRDGPYDAVVVMEDGARGMNFCMSIRGYSKDVPLLWISDQAEFEPQSRRMQADTFLVKPVTEYQLREAVSQLLQKATRRNEQREEDELNDVEMETAGRIFTGGGNDFYDAGSSGICGGSGCIRRPYGVVQASPGTYRGLRIYGRNRRGSL